MAAIVSIRVGAALVAALPHQILMLNWWHEGDHKGRPYGIDIAQGRPQRAPFMSVKTADRYLPGILSSMPLT